MTRLDGGVSTGEPASTNVTDQDILDITDLIFFIDFDNAASIDPNPIAVNENITSITSRLTPDSYVFATTGLGIVYSAFGETNSMLSNVNWKYALDSTTVGNVDEGDTACLTMMFRTKDVLAQWNWIFKILCSKSVWARRWTPQIIWDTTTRTVRCGDTPTS